MENLIDTLRARTDIVVFDSPPCLPVTDAQVLSTKIDGVVLVVEVGEARKAAVQHAKRLFDQAHARTLGLVFNKIPQHIGDGYYYYSRGYYSEEPKALRNGKARPPDGSESHALAPVDAVYRHPGAEAEPSHEEREA
jgi:Mrp family chromosome partitioning ATPase